MKKTMIISQLLLSLSMAKEFSHSLSNQGFSGVINTPNAQVMNVGDLSFHFDNQFNNVLRHYNYNQTYRYSENYVFGISLLQNFEMQLRLSEVKNYHRDLSANLKFKLPYTHKYLPNIAFGYQDLGSAKNFYGNYYTVLDK